MGRDALHAVIDLSGRGLRTGDRAPEVEAAVLYPDGHRFPRDEHARGAGFALLRCIAESVALHVHLNTLTFARFMLP